MQCISQQLYFVAAALLNKPIQTSISLGIGEQVLAVLESLQPPFCPLKVTHR